jgi:hypothetical protein
MVHTTLATSKSLANIISVHLRKTSNSEFQSTLDSDALKILWTIMMEKCLSISKSDKGNCTAVLDKKD